MKGPNVELLQKKAEKVRARHGISVEDAETIRRTAYDVFEYCASDLPAENKRGTIRRAVVIEVALDAGRLLDTREGNFGMPNRNRSAADKVRLTAIVRATTYPELIDLVGPAFPYAEYESGQPMIED